MSSEHQFCDYNFGGQDDFGPAPTGGNRMRADIRRDFEDAARTCGWPLGRINESDSYSNPTTQARWEAWQAALSML